MSRALALVFLSTFGAMSGFYLLLSVLPLYVTSIGVGKVGAGSVTAALMFSTVAAELCTPWLVGRFGRRRVLVVGMALLGAPALTLPGSASLAAILVVCVVRGLGFAITVVVTGAIVASLVPPERRGEGLGLYGLVIGVPSVIALPLGVWLTGQIGYTPVFIAGAVTTLCGAAAALGVDASNTPATLPGAPSPEPLPPSATPGVPIGPSVAPEPFLAAPCGEGVAGTSTAPRSRSAVPSSTPPPPSVVFGGGASEETPATPTSRIDTHGAPAAPPEHGARRDRRGPSHGPEAPVAAGGREVDGVPDKPFGVLAALRTGGLVRPAVAFSATAMAAGAIFTFLPVAVGHGSGTLAAAALLAMSMSATFARWWAGRDGDRHGSGRLLLPGVLVAAAGVLGLVLIGSPVAVMAGAVVFGAGYGAAQNTSLTSMFEQVSASGYGTVSALWNLAFDAGLGVGAAGFGVLASRTGYPAAFAVTTALMFGMLIVARDGRRGSAR